MFYVSVIQADDITHKSKEFDAGRQFQPFSDNRMTTIHNLCIEDPSSPFLHVYGRLRNVTYNGRQITTKPCYIPGKVLVSYGSETNSTVDVNSFRVTQSIREIPEDYTVYTYPAYFVKKRPESMTNFYHFWTNFMCGLFTMMKLTDRLDPPGINRLFFPEPALRCTFTENRLYFRDFMLEVGPGLRI